MKLLDITWNPTNRQLRQFGIICLIALPCLGWVWNGGPRTVGLLAVAGLAVAVASLVLPKTVKPVFVALTIVTAPIGLVFGELAMLFIYFGVFLPIGMLFRLTRRDALQMKLDRQARTYWQAKKRPDGVASYYRQS